VSKIRQCIEYMAVVADKLQELGVETRLGAWNRSMSVSEVLAGLRRPLPTPTGPLKLWVKAQDYSNTVREQGFKRNEWLTYLHSYCGSCVRLTSWGAKALPWEEDAVVYVPD
jgi:hypothetical protein